MWTWAAGEESWVAAGRGASRRKRLDFGRVPGLESAARCRLPAGNDRVHGLSHPTRACYIAAVSAHCPAPCSHRCKWRKNKIHRGCCRGRDLAGFRRDGHRGMAAERLDGRGWGRRESASGMAFITLGSLVFAANFWNGENER